MEKNIIKKMPFWAFVILIIFITIFGGLAGPLFLIAALVPVVGVWLTPIYGIVYVSGLLAIIKKLMDWRFE